MKKNKFSSVEKKKIRMIIVWLLIQFLIVFLFMLLMKNSQQIDINDTKTIDIVVDDIYCFKIPKEERLIVVANSKDYLFTGRATFKDYSIHELHNAISKGDRLTLRYYESYSVLFKKVNIVVDARTETEIFRTFEEYNRGKQGVSTGIVVIFSVIELLFVAFVFVYVWFYYSTIKEIYRKIQKY